MKTLKKKPEKPPYRVPSMAEIAAVPWNGLRVASTFSGCGGSCLGYRMAGFRVVWANEFVPAAQASYEANAAPGCVLDRRDVRLVRPEEVLAAAGLKEGELDLFDGSPPCASFSTAGKREKGWGDVRDYSDTRQRTDDLFFEYARLLRGLMPRAFVAENVSGLVKGTAKGYFIEILRALKGCGYNVEARLLDAQWLGVPQMRQRIIFVGTRKDLPIRPAFPRPLPYRYSVADALQGVRLRTKSYSLNGWSPADGPAASVVTHGLYKVEEVPLPPSRGPGGYNVSEVDLGRPCPTVTTASPGNDIAGDGEVVARRKMTIAELKRICGFPDDFVLVGSYAQQWERLGRAVPPVMMSRIAAAIGGELCKRPK